MTDRNLEQLKEFTQQWVRRLEGDTSVDEKVENTAVLISFMRPPEYQWAFIMAAMEIAETKDSLVAIAAGPVEHLLANHGDAYIDAVEVEARSSPKFGRMLNGVWKNAMSDAIWARIQALQTNAET